MQSGITRRALAGGALAALAFPPRLSAAPVVSGAFDAGAAGVRPGIAEDQGAALREALLKAQESGLPLFLPPGRYQVSGVELPPRAHLVGIPGESLLVFAGGAAMLRAAHGERLRLEGITLDGGGRPLAAEALLDADDIAEIVIANCAFLASAGAGIHLARSAGRVENSRFDHNATIGVYLRQSKGMSIEGNVVGDCGDTGILVARDAESEDGSIVRGNRVSRIRADSGGTGQNGNGINLDKANGVVIADNRVDDCAFSAIRCFSSDSVAVTGNIATNSGEMAFYVEFAFEGAIVADNLIDGANGGISFANFMEHGGRLGTCSGNVVRNIRGGPAYPDGNLQNGAAISAEADAAVTGNTIEDALWGIQLGWGPYLRDVAVTGNVIRRTQIGIAVSVAEGAGAALIANNLIAEAAQGAILAMRWDEVASGELLDGAPDFPALTISSNRKG